ncbi:MAG TPA: class I SAM-dependent methyltransferase [Opitutaceae bacterium]|nr:class I SAM-dependent methyltransferase [Opitutaceae bacterium]
MGRTKRARPRSRTAATAITGATVRADFNDPNVVIHYTRAADRLGLWASERRLIERWLPDRAASLLDAGCGAGRVALGLWQLGYRHLTGVDFAAELIDQARGLAAQHRAAIDFVLADVTRLGPVRHAAPGGFAGAMFLFNGLMQIPGRGRRRRALRELRAACRPGAILLFTTHDREDDPREQPHWAAEAQRWAVGEQDPCLVEYGDRHFRDSHGGHTFMHLPTRGEVLEDLGAAGWAHRFDAMRRAIAAESEAVREFSDECRFWVAQRN